MSNGTMNCLTGVCCDDQGWDQVRTLAAFLKKESENDESVYYDKFERAAAALLKIADIAPKGVGGAIVAGYRPIMFEEFQRQQKKFKGSGESEE